MDYIKSDVDVTSNTFVKSVTTIRTPQRKARLSDRNRWRLKPLKEAVFKETGIRSSGIIKKCLRHLGVKLDLRLTSAWKALMMELLSQIVEIRKVVIDPVFVPAITSKFKKGDRVIWTGYSPLESSICQHFPLVVGKIEDGLAYLDFLYRPVPVEEIEFAA